MIKIDWLNYAADAIAEDEYDKPDGLDLQNLMLTSIQVTIQVHGSRLVDYSKRYFTKHNSRKATA